MANCKNFIYGILIASAWCILVCSSRLETSGDIYNRGSTDMHLHFGDSSESYVDQNVNSQGSGDTFINYGDCSSSSLTTNIFNYGSGDTYLLFGYSSASSQRLPSDADNAEEWAKNIYTLGSGDLYISYGRCGTSSNSRMVENVYNRGSGDIKIMYRSYTRSKEHHKIYNVGSGKVYVKYANQDSYEQERSANIDEELDNNLYSQDSERVNMIHGNPERTTSSVERNEGIRKTWSDLLPYIIENHYEIRSKRVQLLTR